MPEPADNDVALSVYLLGQVDFEALLALQRRLVYEVSGTRDHAALLICEHPPLISVGRQGSHADIHIDAAELQLKDWPVRWVNRGGGCLLHATGQLAVYPILPLSQLGLDLTAYLRTLKAVLIDVTGDACVRGARVDPAGVAVGSRLLAHVGIAVRDWVAYFGAVLNVNPDLGPFKRIYTYGDAWPMTSLERERRLAVHPALVRQRLVERFVERFNFSNVSVFHEHPTLPHSAYPDWPMASLVASDPLLRPMTAADSLEG